MFEDARSELIVRFPSVAVAVQEGTLDGRDGGRDCLEKQTRRCKSESGTLSGGFAAEV